MNIHDQNRLFPAFQILNQLQKQQEYRNRINALPNILSSSVPKPDYVIKSDSIAAILEHKYANTGILQYMEALQPQTIQTLRVYSTALKFASALRTSELQAAQENLNRIISALTSHDPRYQIHPDDEEAIEKSQKLNEKISEEILNASSYEKEPLSADSPILVCSPITPDILKYLADHPDMLYKLDGHGFESVMAELYHTLGYDVVQTQMTRDGGKDLIITDHSLIGDFIFYVECKKYSPQHHVGLGIVQRLKGVVDNDKVNGGIIATTSFLSKDARDFIINNKNHFHLKVHDYHTIRQLLKESTSRPVEGSFSCKIL